MFQMFQKQLSMKHYNTLIYKASQNSFSETLYKFSKISPYMSFGVNARI